MGKKRISALSWQLRNAVEIVKGPSAQDDFHTRDKKLAATKTSSPNDGLLFDYCLELISGYICLMCISGGIPSPPILCERRNISHRS